MLSNIYFKLSRSRATFYGFYCSVFLSLASYQVCQVYSIVQLSFEIGTGS